jgi:hypothetical protein
VIPKADLPVVVEAYLAGVTIPELVKRYGVSRRGLYNWMLSGLGDEKYREVMTQMMTARIADADEELEGAEDKVGVAKWSQLGKFARMDYERRRPNLYGQKQETRVVHEVEIGGELQARMDAILKTREPKLIEDDSADVG